MKYNGLIWTGQRSSSSVLSSSNDRTRLPYAWTVYLSLINEKNAGMWIVGQCNYDFKSICAFSNDESDKPFYAKYLPKMCDLTLGEFIYKFTKASKPLLDQRRSNEWRYQSGQYIGWVCLIRQQLNMLIQTSVRLSSQIVQHNTWYQSNDEENHSRQAKRSKKLIITVSCTVSPNPIPPVQGKPVKNFTTPCQGRVSISPYRYEIPTNAIWHTWAQSYQVAWIRKYAIW